VEQHERAREDEHPEYGDTAAMHAFLSGMQVCVCVCVCVCLCVLSVCLCDQTAEMPSREHSCLVKESYRREAW
jgi:hypothetical protein